MEEVKRMRRDVAFAHSGHLHVELYKTLRFLKSFVDSHHATPLAARRDSPLAGGSGALRVRAVGSGGGGPGVRPVGGAAISRNEGGSAVLTNRPQTRYGLPVRVSEPVKTEGKVSTWKLIIETRPGQKHLPAQRIHLDICAIPSHDPRPMMLRNPYGVDLGTSGLILQAQSHELSMPVT